MDEVDLFEDGRRVAIVLVPKGSNFEIISWQSTFFVRVTEARKDGRRAMYTKGRVYTAIQAVQAHG